ncbi:MAG: transcriptional regulator [Spirochaetota bacterium]
MSETRYAYQGLDHLLHAPARLSIATALYANRDGLTVVELRELCELSDGNLSRHLRKLEAEHVVHTAKHFVGRVPQTSVAMTAAGRERFERYVEQIRDIVERDVPAAERSTTSAPAWTEGTTV